MSIWKNSSDVRRLRTKQLFAFAVAPALLLLAVDAWIGHFAGKDGLHRAQWIPVYFGVLAAAVLLIIGVAPWNRLSWATFRMAMRGVALLSFVIGIAGTGFHLMPLLEDLKGEPFHWSSLLGALSVAPPLFAPGAFAGLGALLWMVASKRVLLRIQTGLERRGAKLG